MTSRVENAPVGVPPPNERLSVNCQLWRSIPQEAADRQLAVVVPLDNTCIRRRPLETPAPVRLIVGVPSPWEL